MREEHGVASKIFFGLVEHPIDLAPAFTHVCASALRGEEAPKKRRGSGYHVAASVLPRQPERLDDPFGRFKFLHSCSRLDNKV